MLNFKIEKIRPTSNDLTPKKEGEPDEPRQKSLLERMSKRAAQGTLGLTLLALVAGTIEKKVDQRKLPKFEPGSKSTSGDVIPQEVTSGGTNMDLDRDWPHLHQNLMVKDAQGNWQFHWEALLAPVILEERTEEAIEGRVTIGTPYEFTPQFDNPVIGPLRPGDQERAAKNVEGQIKKELANVLERFFGTGIGAEAIETAHRNDVPERIRLSSLHNAKGTASMEAGTPESVEYGHVDPENTELAGTRGVEGTTMILEQFKRLGVDTRNIDPKQIAISGEEIQPDWDVFFQMHAYAIYHYEGTPEECLLQAARDYNDGKIQNPVDRAIFDKGLGAARSVEVTVDYEGKRTRSYPVPLPLLPPLLYGLFRIIWQWDRNKNGKTSEVPKQTPPTEPTPDIPPLIKETPVPPDEKTRVKTVVDDLWNSIGSEYARQRGLDYTRIVHDMDIFYDDETFTEGKSAEESDAARIDQMSHWLLGEWARCDAYKIQEQGLNHENIKLDDLVKKMRDQYETSPHQVRYAKAHAAELLDALKIMRANENEYPEINDAALRKALRPRAVKLAERNGRVVS